MSSEILRIMAEQLARRWEQLSELDAIEQAETVVRDHHEYLLLGQIAEILPEMESVIALLSERRAADDSIAVGTAQEHLREIETTACILLEKITGQRNTSREAIRAYKAGRAHLMNNIQALQLAINRRRSEEESDGVLRWPPAV